MKVRYRARALADIDNIFRFLDERNPTGAINVLRAIRGAIDEIADSPLASQRTNDPEIRVKALGRYR